MTHKFRYVRPLRMSLLRAEMGRLHQYIKLYDDTGDHLILNLIEARCLRDWLSKALKR